MTIKRIMNSSSRIIIEKAADREHEAYEFYTENNKRTEIGNLKSIFTKLAIEELKHERLLRDILTLEDFDKAIEKSNSEHPFQTSVIEDVDPHGNLEFIGDTLDVAIKMEQESFEIYDSQYKIEKSEDLKRLFLFLAKEEAKHKSLLMGIREKF